MPVLDSTVTLPKKNVVLSLEVLSKEKESASPRNSKFLKKKSSKYKHNAMKQKQLPGPMSKSSFTKHNARSAPQPDAVELDHQAQPANAKRTNATNRHKELRRNL